MGNSKTAKIMKDLNKEVTRLNREKTKKSKFEMWTCVRVKLGEIYHHCAVKDIIAIDKGSQGIKYYYDLLMMKPLHKGSAILHTIEGVVESQISR